MIGRLFRKYRWYFVAILVLYTAISVWLLYATDAPQAVPFDYQIR